MVRIRQFEFLCRSMHIEPTVNHFLVFYQFHCSQGFYSFAQRSSAKKILLHPSKSFHDWKPKFFFIKAGVIPMKITFRGTEDIMVENMKTPLLEIWCQDLKDVPSIELPERVLVATGMSLYWKMDREDKPVYMEGDKIVSLYVIANKRENGKMSTILKGDGEELWYLQIFRNFALPRDEDLSRNLQLVSKQRVPAVIIALKAQSSKAKNVKGGKKGTRHSSDSLCDYVVVSDTLEGLAPVVARKPKAEPRDTADIPASNPDDPIDLELSPEPEAQPAKKVPKRKIGKRGNLDAFIRKPPPCTKAAETEVEKVVKVGNPEVEKPVEVEMETEKVVEPETADVDVSQPKSPEVVTRDLENGKSVPEDPLVAIPTSATTSAPVNIERIPVGDQGFFTHDEENSPIRPKETPGDYYYRTYSEKKASDIHAPVWNLKKSDTFSD
ncbi:hypothetical protein HanHA300_Chr12g0455711 [Helianthus annuus]|nr:hypothetical protein HanHA300_Chr12g0455711 [Helianthus annuus]